MERLQYALDTELGPFYLVATEKGLQSALFEKQEVPFAMKLDGANQAERNLQEAVKQLQEYFSGKRTEFQLQLDLAGTDFQQQVWKELSKIPFGKTLSYKDVAQRIHNPKAVRAVGTANGRNPLCIVIPCHRVITADGKLGGYSGGLHLKKKLLELESIKTL